MIVTSITQPWGYPLKVPSFAEAAAHTIPKLLLGAQLIIEWLIHHVFQQRQQDSSSSHILQEVHAVHGFILQWCCLKEDRCPSLPEAFVDSLHWLYISLLWHLWTSSFGLLTCFDVVWHVLTCFDMFWHVLTGNATWCNILVPCPAITPRELEIDFDRGVALCVVDCRLQPHRSSSRIQLHHIPIWNIHFFHDQLVGKWSFHPSACFILRGVAGNEQLAVHLLVKFSKKIVELRESTCTQLCLPLRWLGNCWQQKELSKLRAMNLRVVRCPFSPDHFSRCSAEKGEHGDIDCTPVILMPWFSHGLNVPNQSLKPLIYSI